MTKRKRKILVFQIIFFFLALIVIYLTYYQGKSTKLEKETPTKQSQNIEKQEQLVDRNTFEDVEYNGIDLNGNRYSIKSEKAEFKVESPELIDMKVMNAVFYFKDGTILKVRGDYGNYNNKTNDMEFRDNIIVEYQDNFIYGDNLDYLNTKNLLSVYGNVVGKGIKGDIVADKLKFDLSIQTLDISMFDNNQVDVNLK